MLNTLITATNHDAGRSGHGVNTFNTILKFSLLQEPQIVMATKQKSGSRHERAVSAPFAARVPHSTGIANSPGRAVSALAALSLVKWKINNNFLQRRAVRCPHGLPRDGEYLRRRPFRARQADDTG